MGRIGMKLGSHVSSLQRERQAPYEEGVANAGLLGFDGVELICMNQAELTQYYTPERCRSLRDLADKHKLVVTQFAIFSTACEGLASLDPKQKQEGIDIFLRGMDRCVDLECGIVNLVAHWPIGLASPHPYPPSYIHPASRGVTQVNSSKFTMSLPGQFDFGRTWDNYVDSIRILATAAAERKIRLAIEGHAHVIVSGTDAMLRLFDSLADPACVINFDTAWHFVQREYLPMSIAKLGQRIAHVHLRDADGQLYYGAPVGQGVIDWHGVIRALKQVGYAGFLSFEYAGFEDFLGVTRRSKEYIARVLEEAL